MVKITVSRTDLLVDEKLRVVVRGLEPCQRVTVTARVEEKQRVFASYAAFTADRAGELDLSTAPSQNGSYTGVSQMGLFWSMKPTPGMRAGTRLLKQDVTTPLHTLLSVYHGHVTLPDPGHAQSAPLGTVEVRRWYKDPDVERIEVREDGLVGTLFLPAGCGQVPGLIDLFGSVGGVVEYRAALFASRGFAALALGYIDFNRNPPGTSDLEYFVKAVNFLRNHPRVQRSGVGTIGVSKGAEICLLLSIICPHVKAVVAIGGVPWGTGVEHTYKGWKVPVTGTIDDSYERIKTTEGERFIVRAERVPHQNIIPVERTHAKLLLVSGDDDSFVPEETDHIVEARLRAAQRTDVCRIIRYKDAGHLLEPPYSPHCRASYVPFDGNILVWGGYTAQHAKAQEDLWPKILTFFKEILVVPNVLQKL